MSTEEKVASIFTEIEAKLDLNLDTDLTPELNMEYIANLARDTTEWKSTEEEFRRNVLNLATWCVELVYQIDSGSMSKGVLEKCELKALKEELDRTKALHENLKNTIAQSDANRVALKAENDELKAKAEEANNALTAMVFQYNRLMQDSIVATAAKKSSKQKK